MRRAPATMLGCATAALLYVWLGAGNLQAATISVHGRLTADITGSHSVAMPEDSGNDGDAHNTIVEAADRAETGEVLIGAGADRNTKGNAGSTPSDHTSVDWELIQGIATLIGSKVDQETGEAARSSQTRFSQATRVLVQ